MVGGRHPLPRKKGVRRVIGSRGYEGGGVWIKGTDIAAPAKNQQK